MRRNSLLLLVGLMVALLITSCAVKKSDVKKESPTTPKKVEQPKKTPEQIQAEEKNKRLDAEYKKAYTAFQSNNYTEAINIADSIIKEDPNYYQSYSIKGIALCYSQEYNDGMANIDKALQLKPDYQYGRFNKALALELWGYYNDALKWYDKALELNNNDVWSYYGKASIYGRGGDVANTVKYLQKAINLDASVKNFARDEKDFDPVRSSDEFQQLVK